MNLFAEWHPHFIWLDIGLPGMSGLEVATHIRELPGGREAKIVALTASVFEEQREAVLAVGVDDFVRKPARPGTVFERMAKLLGVRYVQSTSTDMSIAGSGRRELAAVEGLPEELKSQLLQAVLLLDKEGIADAIRLVSEIDPELGRELTRHGD